MRFDRGASPRAARRLALTLVLTLAIMAVELVGGVMAGSLALLADAGHMLTDVLALMVALAAILLGRRPADERRTYGYRRLEILAALANGVALVVVSGSIVIEAIARWRAPQPVDATLMSAVAALGLAGNLVGIALLRGHLKTLNLRSAFLHLMGDALSSVGVLVAALVMRVTGWPRVDALVSLGIALIIVITSVGLLREVVEVLLEAAPTHIDTDSVRATIGTVAGVDGVHDLHVWSITSGMPALSAHIVVKNTACDADAVLSAIQGRLRDEYAIDHSTLQIERRPAADCGCE